MASVTPDVLIVGAGLSGLCCAKHLLDGGWSCQVVEASDTIGGRVRTDPVDGFLLDRGFQVLLTAYPETQRVLDYAALDLHPFYPGALVRFNNRFYRVADPWRHPLDAILSLVSPIGTTRDKWRVARLRRHVRSGSLDALFNRSERTTLEALREAGFSSAMIERFFRPFLGGVFLERELQTSSRLFEFVFRMFSLGDTALPAAGMGAIPAQLATGFSAHTVRLRTRVQSVSKDGIVLDSGESRHAPAVVVATEGPEAARLLQEISLPPSRRVTCLYFAADTPPIADALLILNGDDDGPVHHVCVPSAVAPTYAPAGAALISVTVLEDAAQHAALEAAVRAQLSDWFGPSVHRWQHLRTYRLHHAIPAQAPPALSSPQRPVRLRPGLYVCGDHRETASIHGAMVSGRRAAAAIMADLNQA